MAPTKYAAVQRAKKRKRTMKLHIKKMNAARLLARRSRELATAAAKETDISPASTGSSSCPCATPSETKPEKTPMQLPPSQRKLAYLSATSPKSEPPCLPTTITDLNSLAPLFKGLLCKTCCKPELSLIQGKGSKAYAVNLQVYCSNCNHICSEAFTSG